MSDAPASLAMRRAAVISDSTADPVGLAEPAVGCGDPQTTSTARESFSVRSVREGRLWRLTPTGELDIATAPILRAEFEALQSEGDAERIVIDLTELSFMDCSGIRLLLQMNDDCGPAGQLRVVNGSRPVQRVLDLTGVRSQLPIISPNDDPLALLPAPA